MVMDGMRRRAGLLATAALMMTSTACGRTYLWPGPESNQGTGANGTGGTGASGATGGTGASGATGGTGGTGASGATGGTGGTGASGATGGTGGTGASGATGGTGGTGGAPPVCTINADCDDSDFCTTDECVAGTCSYKTKDADDDGFIDELCGGLDCNDLNPQVHPGMGELCSDAADNDCNGVADCFDPVCLNDPNCGCVPAPGGENCTNKVDDDCDTTVDCNDADCMGTPACGCSVNEVGLCDDGLDNDCDNLFDCDDGDCAGDSNCICQATPEQCSNNADEDCDLLIDCADPDCAGDQACSCVPPGKPEICNDNIDNDCDLMVDCADAACAASPACKNCVPEICDNNKDDDCDNAIDCADESCAFAPNCLPVAEICNNSLDDDNDLLVDCDDPDCANNPLCVIKQSNCLTAKLITGSGQHTGTTEGFVGEHIGGCGGGAGEAIFYFVLSEPSYVHLDSIGTSFDSVLYVRHGSCDYGPEIACDDDSGNYQWSAAIDFTILYPGTYYVYLDGFTIDPMFGANDGPFVLNVVIEPNPKEDTVQRCGDGLDNDGDVYIDCGDPGCQNVGSCVLCNNGAPPTAEFGVARCTDGQDNDCDGFSDELDSDCDNSPYASALEDCTGTDQNDNGIADDFSCRCAVDAECSGGQMCYTHTIQSCGLPCFNFYGDVCPSISTGTYCNQSTGQCEF